MWLCQASRPGGRHARDSGTPRNHQATTLRLPAPLLIRSLSRHPQRLRKEMKKAIDEAVEERILNALLGDAADADTRSRFRMLYR